MTTLGVAAHMLAFNGYSIAKVLHFFHERFLLHGLLVEVDRDGFAMERDVGISHAGRRLKHLLYCRCATVTMHAIEMKLRSHRRFSATRESETQAMACEWHAGVAEVARLLSESRL
jgi:hypothetical protein